MATAAHESQTLHDSKAGEDGPDKERKGDSGLGRPVVVTAVRICANVDGHRDGAGEPEYRGDSEQAEGDDGIVRASEETRRQREVEEYEYRPDGAKEEECERRRRAVPWPGGNVDN